MTILSAAWHAEALTDPRTPREPDAPKPGTYRVRGSRSGAWRALRIWSEGGTVFAMLSAIQIAPDYIDRLWPYAQPITESDYRRLLASPPNADILRTPTRPESQGRCDG